MFIPFSSASLATAAVVANNAWPVTTQDIAHARDDLRFLPCDVPKVSGVRVVADGGRRTVQTDELKLTMGCVDDIEIERYVWCWRYGGLISWQACGTEPTRSRFILTTPKLESVRLFPAETGWAWLKQYYEQRF